MARYTRAQAAGASLLLVIAALVVALTCMDRGGQPPVVRTDTIYISHPADTAARRSRKHRAKKDKKKNQEGKEAKKTSRKGRKKSARKPKNKAPAPQRKWDAVPTERL